MKNSFSPEFLRPLDHVLEPDPRSNFVTGSLERHHSAISQIKLNSDVPENVRIQFETVRNLYLYSWFIYRFYPVSEHQAFCCLEFALKERFKEVIKSRSNKGREKMTLQPLLKFAIEKGYIKNEGFEIWRHAVKARSLDRLRWHKFNEMTEQGLQEISWDESDAQVTADDMKWDYCSVLLKSIPTLRNEHGHGSDMLYNTVLNSLKIVSEIINQIYCPGSFELDEITMGKS